MIRFICLVLALILMFTCCASAEDNGDDVVEIMLSGMSLRDKVAQMMIASFRIGKEVPETEAAAETEEQTEPPAETEEETDVPAETGAQTEESTDSVVFVERGPGA